MSKEHQRPNDPKQSGTSELEKLYSPEALQKQVERVRKRLKSASPAPRCTTIVEDGETSLKMNVDVNGLAALMEACGTTDDTFAQILTSDLGRALC